MTSCDYSDHLFTNQPLHGVMLTRDSCSDKNQILSDETLTALPIWRNRRRSVCTSEPIWLKEESGDRYKSQLALYKQSCGYLLKINCEGKGEFEYTPEGIGIYWEPEGTGPAHYFQTLGLSLWLELRGVPCIHANCLAKGDKAIGIIAPSRVGKTTLTAALLDRGLQMMTDDMLALYRRSGEWIVYPGWLKLRMWPDIASAYTGSSPKKLDKVHARFEKRVVDLKKNKSSKTSELLRSLSQLLLIERNSEEVKEVYIQNISPGEALIHLLQNSILGDAYQALGIESARLNRLAGLLDQVPLRKMSYPSGLQYLPKVCEQIHAEFRILKKNNN